MKKGIGFALAFGLASVLAAEPAPDQTQSNKKPKPEARAGEELISLDLKDADLRDVLRTFATLERINIAIDPDVRGSVTIRLNDVRWDQALDVILRSNGLGYVIEGNVLRIGTPARLADR